MNPHRNQRPPDGYYSSVPSPTQMVPSSSPTSTTTRPSGAGVAKSARSFPAVNALPAAVTTTTRARVFSEACSMASASEPYIAWVIAFPLHGAVDCERGRPCPRRPNRLPRRRTSRVVMPPPGTAATLAASAPNGARRFLWSTCARVDAGPLGSGERRRRRDHGRCAAAELLAERPVEEGAQAGTAPLRRHRDFRLHRAGARVAHHPRERDQTRGRRRRRPGSSRCSRRAPSNGRGRRARPPIHRAAPGGQRHARGLAAVAQRVRPARSGGMGGVRPPAATASIATARIARRSAPPTRRAR